MRLDHLQCRDFGHSWRPFSAWFHQEHKEFVQTLRCQRCTSTRTRYLSARGAIIQSSYDYADGYTMPRGLGRMTGEDRDHIRLQSVLRTMPEDTAEER